MFKERLISGIILLLIAVTTLYYGGIITWGVVFAISLVAQFEFLRVFKLDKTGLSYISYGFTCLYYLLLIIEDSHSMIAIPIFILLIMTSYVLTFPKYQVSQVLIYIVSFVYIILFLSYIYQIRVLENGGYLIILVFIASWGSDTLAYCAGRLFGKHKMAPVLSPKKTVEGAVGGVLGAVLLGLFYAWIVNNKLDVSYNPMILFPTICFLGAFLSMIGDLTASAIKRNQEIKDYGHLIPGHGGILDRFDSIMFTAPVVYYLAVILGGL